MTKRRLNDSFVPPQLEDLHAHHGGPMIVLDYLVTRRMRIHSLYKPGETHPYSSQSLLELLNLGDIPPDERVLLTHIDSTGMVFACYGRFSSYNQEDLTHGQN